MRKVSILVTNLKGTLDHVKVNIYAVRAGVFLSRLCNDMNSRKKSHTKHHPLRWNRIAFVEGEYADQEVVISAISTAEKP